MKSWRKSAKSKNSLSLRHEPNSNISKRYQSFLHQQNLLSPAKITKFKNPSSILHSSCGVCPPGSRRVALSIVRGARRNCWSADAVSLPLKMAWLQEKDESTNTNCPKMPKMPKWHWAISVYLTCRNFTLYVLSYQRKTQSVTSNHSPLDDANLSLHLKLWAGPRFTNRRKNYTCTFQKLKRCRIHKNASQRETKKAEQNCQQADARWIQMI